MGTPGCHSLDAAPVRSVSVRADLVGRGDAGPGLKSKFNQSQPWDLADLRSLCTPEFPHLSSGDARTQLRCLLL